MANAERCLVVVLLPKMLLAKSTCLDIERGFSHDGRRFSPRSSSDFNGFYDYLRNRGDELLGIRMFPSERFYFLADHLEDKEYASIRRAKDNSPIIELLFSREEAVDELKSDDQEFGCNWLFKSDDGVLALTFNASNLDGRILQSLEEVEIFA